MSSVDSLNSVMGDFINIGCYNIHGIAKVIKAGVLSFCHCSKQDYLLKKYGN